MTYILWSENLSVGIGEMDTEHKRLVNLLNELHDALDESWAADVMKETFEGLIEYTAEHFKNEENLMLVHSYPGYEEHRLEHERLTNHVGNLKKRFEQTGTLVARELTRFLRRWLFAHIASSDKLYGEFITTKGPEPKS